MTGVDETLYVNALLAAVGILGALATLAHQERVRGQRSDVARTLSITVGLAGLVYGFSLLVLFLGTAVMFAENLLLTYDLQENLSFTPVQAGLAFLPQTLGAVAAALASGVLMRRLPGRLLVPAGMAMVGIGMFPRPGPAAPYVPRGSPPFACQRHLLDDDVPSAASCTPTTSTRRSSCTSIATVLGRAARPLSRASPVTSSSAASSSEEHRAGWSVGPPPSARGHARRGRSIRSARRWS